MKIKRTRNSILATLAALTLTLGGGCSTLNDAKAASPAADSGFSFAAYGDSRTMMYLPYRQDQEAEARAQRHVLALHPRLLGGEGHPRRHLAAAKGRTREVRKPANREEYETMEKTATHNLRADEVWSPNYSIMTAPAPYIRADRVDVNETPIQQAMYQGRVLDAYTIGLQAHVYVWSDMVRYGVRLNY